MTAPPGRAAPATTWSKPPIAAVLAIFAGMVVVLTMVATFSASRVTRDLPFAFLQGPAWLDAWFQFDSGWYYSIAQDGYWYLPGQQSPIAFFPSYPMAVRVLGTLTGDYQIAGTLLAVLCGAGAITLFTVWVWRQLPRGGAITAIALLMLYPYAFYLYGAMYSDSLFLLVTVAAFTLLDRRQYWLAGLVGAVATAGRPVGVAVAIGLVIRMLEMQAQQTADRRAVAAGAPDIEPIGEPGPKAVPMLADGYPRPRFAELIRAIGTIGWRQAGVFVSGLGLAAWCAYLWSTFGDPLLFIEVQAAPGWSQGVGPRTWFKVLYFTTFLEGRFLFALVLSAQAAFSLLAVILLRPVARRFGWGYASYALVVLAIPIIGTRDFMGTGRYVLAAFPVMAAAGMFLATTRFRWLRPVAFGVLGFGLVGATFLYAMGLGVS